MNLLFKTNIGVLSFNISNLLDEAYQRPYGYSQNGRQIRFGFKIYFRLLISKISIILIHELN